ncbi:MAG: hypothetical protein WEB09_05370 [Nitriliruptor sp.]
MNEPSPTVGRAGGEHRVLEPPGGVPLDAARLDALAELWDGEARLELEAVVLGAASHRAWTERLGTDPVRLAGALVESVAERGGLGEEAADATVIGRVGAVGTAHPPEVQVGERVGVAWPATALPLFAAPTPAWDGGPVVPLEGHAIVPPRGVTVPVGDEAVATAALLTQLADLPSALVPGHRLVVLGTDRPAGLVAVAVAAAQGRHVTAVVSSLADARLLRAVGADVAVVLAAGEPVESADHLSASGPPPDLVVVAGGGEALAARLAPSVQVLAGTTPGTPSAIVAHARSIGRRVAIHAGRGIATDRGAALDALLTDRPLLRAMLRWHAEGGPRPAVPPAVDDQELP